MRKREKEREREGRGCKEKIIFKTTVSRSMQTRIKDENNLWFYGNFISETWEASVSVSCVTRFFFAT